MSRPTEAQQLGAIQDLRDFLFVGQDVYVRTITVARSGLSRTVAVYAIDGRKGTPTLYDITRKVSTACGLGETNNRGDLRIHGAGMDMHWWLVDRLGTKLGYDLRKVTL